MIEVVNELIEKLLIILGLKKPEEKKVEYRPEETEVEYSSDFENFKENCRLQGGGIMSKESYEYTKKTTTAKRIIILDKYNDRWYCVKFEY